MKQKKKTTKNVVESGSAVVNMEEEMHRIAVWRRRRMLRGGATVGACLALAAVLAWLWQAGILPGLSAWGNEKETEPVTEASTEYATNAEAEVQNGERTERSEAETGEKIENETEDLYGFEPSTDASLICVRPVDLSGGCDTPTNETALPLGLVTADELRERFGKFADGPAVLIVHTHTTEGYLSGEKTVTDTAFAHTGDTTRSVVAAGDALAASLSAAGIEVLHCTEVFDVPSQIGAYSRAAERIAELCREYPSVRLVVDVHRDICFSADGNLLRAVTWADGKTAAQIRFSVGTGDGFSWECNYTLAEELRATVCEQYPTLCRSTAVKGTDMGQNLVPMSLYVEIGTAGNSTAEAKTAAALAGTALARLLASFE